MPGPIAKLAAQKAQLEEELAAVEEEIATLHGEVDPPPKPAPAKKTVAKKA